MSGFVGIFHLDGAPVDQALLSRMTQFLAFRGPDAQATWSAGPIGFGHTLLRTTEESEHEHQPFTLDAGAPDGTPPGKTPNETWIVADARIDARRELIAALRERGQEPPAGLGATDVELILRAWRAWGEGCVEHLLGDFAFAIWDAPRRRLFCARDHMGVKPFYYVHIGPLVLCSNTLDCIRLHPAVSNRLNDLAVADFLLFWNNQDPATTTFADIQRIPPAHCASWSPEGFATRRYWTMPIDEPVFYKRADDYVDRFHELLREAVGDRLRTNRVGIFLSGGLDSPTLAWAAGKLLSERFSSFGIKAITDINDASPEEHLYAQMSAERLGIPLEFHRPDYSTMDPDWESQAFQTPEPHPTAYAVQSERARWRRAAAHSRLFLYGEGADNALFFERRPYLGYLANRRYYRKLVETALWTAAAQFRPPFWGRIARTLHEWNVGSPGEEHFPDWLERSFATSLGLEGRWAQVRTVRGNSTHPLRPKAYYSFGMPLWQVMFEEQNAGTTRSLLEIRQPFTDLRMVRFLLTVPAVPWCRSKYLIRRSMRGMLPASVLGRRKTGVPVTALMRALSKGGAAAFQPVPELAHYVALDRVPSVGPNVWATQGSLRIRSLNHWLKCSWDFPYNCQEEGVPHDLVGKAVATPGKENL